MKKLLFNSVYSLCICCMADQGNATFTAPMAAVTTGNSFFFQQISGLVKITVGNVHQVDGLFFMGNKSETIGEKYLVDMSENKPVLKLAKELIP